MDYVYNSSFFTSKLKLFARAYLDALPPDVTCLLSMGSSGCSICSAMIALSNNDKLHHVYVKKEGEHSHSKYAGNIDTLDNEIIAIVDDFVDTGHTINALRRWLEIRELQAKYIVIEHGSLSPGPEDKIYIKTR